MIENPGRRIYDIITFGDLCVDLIVTGDDVEPVFGQVEKLVGYYLLDMGGSCSLFACQAARLGLRVGILGKVGKDRFGDLILSRLNECGVDTQYVIEDPFLKTGLGIALCPAGDRAILTYMGTINAVSPDDISEEFLCSSHHLHHASYFLHTRLRPHISDIFSTARKHGVTISLDTNWDPEEGWGEELCTILPFVDIFMPNEQEALSIAGETDLEKAITRLHCLGAKLITIKQGASGAVMSDGKNLIHQRVDPVTGGDAIGAGDSFNAGFLAGWLRGLPLAECLRIGCACGRSVAGAIGGLQGQPFWDAVK